ncbi:hypothetical protein [Paractinoplanes toevensis]|uniref:Uncharacterized protein n=1 Tax=Paractinoplanes toevensis TaxID=571911 RepID=A0A919WDU8_9ACTN|nr:hypothetical protein [Actinoplanes toevensis]GIM98291.1 hypothetical protein Ato02nite_100840 [Actinoplanes toevensis]
MFTGVGTGVEDDVADALLIELVQQPGQAGLPGGFGPAGVQWCLGDEIGPIGVGVGGVEHVLDGCEMTAPVKVGGVVRLRAGRVTGRVNDGGQFVRRDEDRGEQIHAGMVRVLKVGLIDERDRMCRHGVTPSRAEPGWWCKPLLNAA